MGWWEPERCCCCGLREGVLVYGYFGAIMSGIGVIAITSFLFSASSPEPVIEVSADGSEKEIYFTPLVLVGLLLLFLLHFGVYVCLLVGVYRELPRLVYYAYVSISVMTTLWVAAEICDPQYWSSFGGAGFFHLLLSYGLTFYIILCVRSYYHLLRDKASVNAGLV